MMEDGTILKDLVYGEFRMGQLSRGRLLFWYRDMGKWDMHNINIDFVAWE
jgi:hypothetical protein